MFIPYAPAVSALIQLFTLVVFATLSYKIYSQTSRLKQRDLALQFLEKFWQALEALEQDPQNDGLYQKIVIGRNNYISWLDKSITELSLTMLALKIGELEKNQSNITDILQEIMKLKKQSFRIFCDLR